MVISNLLGLMVGFGEAKTALVRRVQLQSHSKTSPLTKGSCRLIQRGEEATVFPQ